jgi:hypothetical protein
MATSHLYHYTVHRTSGGFKASTGVNDRKRGHGIKHRLVALVNQYNDTLL